MALLRRVTTTPTIDFDRVLYDGQTVEGKAVQSFEILGSRTSFSSTSALEDIAEFLSGSVLPTPTGAESWEVVSSSAADAAAGTGVQTVYINYLDNSWLPASTTVTLNGTTPVAIAAMANCRAINWMHTQTVGSGGVAAGNIDLRIAGAGATHERISLGGNMSLTCRYTVPDGYFATVSHWARSCGTNHAQKTLLRATCSRDTRTLLSGVFLFQDILHDPTSVPKRVGPLRYPSRCQIKISTVSANINADVSSSFHVTIYEA